MSSKKSINFLAVWIIEYLVCVELGEKLVSEEALLSQGKNKLSTLINTCTF